jgi:zinc protease
MNLSNRRSLLGLAALASLFSFSGSAFAQKTAAHPKLPEISYQTYKLPNGLQVITHEDHRLPLVSVDLWYHVGPLNEKAGRTGFAHLFEHMMFEGSKHVGEKAHIKYVQGAGATDVNGTTDFDRTNYFETMPANQLELALWLESDRMGFLMEGLDRKLLANQRDVVRNERRQGEGRPYDVANEELFHLLFPEGHPYRAMVIGSHADIEAARIADIRDFHQQFYTPNNASIAIAGDFDAAKLKALLAKYFGPIPAGPPVPPVNVTTPPITSQKRATVTDTVKLSQATIAWLTPAAFTPDSYNVSAGMFALGESKASRLDEALVLKRQVAQSVTCFDDALKLVGTAACQLTAKPGVKLEDLEKIFWEELAKLQSEGPTQEEVEAAKAQALTEKISGLQRLGGFGGVADTLDRYNQYTGDPGYLPKDVAAEEAISVASVKNAAVKYLTKESAVVVYCVPGKKVLNDVPRSPDNTDADVKITNPYTADFETAQNWRKDAPKAGPPVSVHLPVPQTFALANGLKVYVIEQHSLPVLSASIVTRGGSENNTADKSGLAVLTGQLLDEATTTRDVQKLAQDQERIGTRVAGGVGMDSASQGMTVLTQYTKPGMEVFSDVVQHPAFASDDLDRLRKQRLVAIQQETDNVGAMAARVGPKLVYGDTPYGLAGAGTLKSVGALTREDVTSFYANHYAASDSALILVGDVTLAEAHHLADEYFGKWSGKASSAATIPPAPELPATHVVIVDKPGAPQTALQAYGIGIPATSPDIQAVSVMNYTLGGAFASRINMNLREKNGYTYGANSVFSSYRDGGPFSAGGLVRTDVTGSAAKELMSEIVRFPDNPSTETELKEAKDARIQSLPGAFETTGSIASSIASIFLFNRPLDYYATLADKYRAVTPADVSRVAKEDIHPGHLIIVAAGDRAKIEKQLKDANLGAVEVRDIDGNLVDEKK